MNASFRQAGFSYLRYVNTCSAMVRKCIKPSSSLRKDGEEGASAFFCEKKLLTRRSGHPRPVQRHPLPLAERQDAGPDPNGLADGNHEQNVAHWLLCKHALVVLRHLGFVLAANAHSGRR